MTTTVRQRLALAGSAGAGIVGAHWLAYLAAASDPHERAHMLAGTGHRFFPLIAAAALGLLLFTTGRFIGSRAGACAPLPRVLPTLLRLAPLQIVGFLGLEALERALFSHGASFALLTEAPVLIGLALQVVVAIVGAGLLVALAKAVDLFTTRDAASSDTEVVPRFDTQFRLPVARFAVGAITLRGPPLPS